MCSWHKEDPKEDAALTAWRIQQQQPWWIQPHMGLYDVNVSAALCTIDFSMVKSIIH